MPAGPSRLCDCCCLVKGRSGGFDVFQLVVRLAPAATPQELVAAAHIAACLRLGFEPRCVAGGAGGCIYGLQGSVHSGMLCVGCCERVIAVAVAVGSSIPLASPRGLVQAACGHSLSTQLVTLVFC